MTDVVHDLRWFEAEVRRQANAQFETANHRRIMELPLSVERARLWALQMKFWLENRRNCWGFAQGLVPMDVKKMIWDHERDELEGDAARGIEDHGALHVRESGVLGLTPADFANLRIAPETRAITYAYIHLVKDSPWLKAVSACAALEITNSTEWVEGGGFGYRKGLKMERELGIPFEKQVMIAEHAQVDVDHAHMIVKIARAHGTSAHALELMLEGILESWELDDAWKGSLVTMMERLPGPLVAAGAAS